MLTCTKNAVLIVMAVAISGLASDIPPIKIENKKAAEKPGVPQKIVEDPFMEIPSPPSPTPQLRMPLEPRPKIPELPAPIPDEELLKRAGLETEPAPLLAFFRTRTPEKSDRVKTEAAIRQLGSPSYRKREEASRELIDTGVKIIDDLREAMQSDDPEISTRAEKCLQSIRQEDVAWEISAAAIRILAKKRPEGSIEVLFGYLQTARCLGIGDEIRDALINMAKADAKLNAALVNGLQDSIPACRAIAAEVLCKTGAGADREKIRKLLKDPDVFVRFRAARCLAVAGDAGAVPVLIDIMPQLTYDQAWQVDDILFRLGEGKRPPMLSVGRDEATRKKSQQAWRDWWEKEGKNVDMTKLNATPAVQGFTMVVLLDEGRVVELGMDNKPRWSVEKLDFPLDAQVLPGDRLLVAEYYGHMVTERNLKGEILWKKEVPSPLVAQRLTNGHTFIATDSRLVEFDRQEKEVVSIQMEFGERIMKALKLPNNEIACLISCGDPSGAGEVRVARLNANGRELHSFNVELSTRLFGGRIHMLANGHVLVPHNGESKVVEYDVHGKAVWEVAVVQPIAAFRLANGNTLVTSMQPALGATEFSPAGLEVWSFRHPTRVTRAMRR